MPVKVEPKVEKRRVFFSGFCFDFTFYGIRRLRGEKALGYYLKSIKYRRRAMLVVVILRVREYAMIYRQSLLIGHFTIEEEYGKGVVVCVNV